MTNVQTEYKETEKVKIFCGICDFYKPKKPCGINGAKDQARYVQRDWCGWADIRGTNVNVTTKNLEFILPDSKIIVVSRADEERIKSAIEKHKKAYAKK